MWQLMLGDGAAWNSTVGDVPIVNEWTHVAVTFEQTDADNGVLIGISRLFINGELAATRTGARYVPQASGYPLRIGAGANAISTGNYHFGGKLADVRIYSRALSNEEVAAMCPWQ